MKNTIALFLLFIGTSAGLFAQDSKIYYDGEGFQAIVYYAGNLNAVNSVSISGKRSGNEKLVWLKTTLGAKKLITNNGKQTYEYYITDENKERYRLWLESDFSKASATKFNSNGKALRVWNLKGRRESANSNTNSTLVFDGRYAVRFDYDKKAKKMSNLQFSTDKDRKTYTKFEVYDIDDYEDGGYRGKLYTVKDAKGRKFTILYADSFNYIMVTPVDDRTAEGVTLYLKK